MKKLLLFAILFAISPALSFGQFHGYKVKGGIQGNFLYPLTELTSDQFSWSARGFVNVELAKHLGLELGIGYGYWNLTDELTQYPYPAGMERRVKTELIPIDLRLRYSPFNMKNTNPYFYGGFGMLRYVVKEGEYSHNDDKNPVIGTRTSRIYRQNGWAPNVSVGTGLEVKLADGVALDINTGFTYMLHDDETNNVKWGDLDDAQLHAGLGFTFGGAVDADDDKDGLLNSKEELIGTNPNNPDTDGDGLIDGEEVNKYYTNPLNKDSDNDGLNDYEEVMKNKTLPMNPDSDGDKLKDGEEVLTYRTNPLNIDTDNDGLNDYAELMTYKTDPLNSDTDNDGLNDGDEVNTYNTNPLSKDSDNDMLTDGDEVLKYKTNPLAADTDKGSVNDGVEVNRGTDPLNPADDVEKEMEVGEKLILEGINFETNSSSITPDSEDILNKSLKYIQAHPNENYEISGHTDSRGSRNHNMKLSKDRADSVKDWLVNKGVDASRLTTEGYGPDQPVDSNDSEEGRAKNRRIEFKRTK